MEAKAKEKGKLKIFRKMMSLSNRLPLKWLRRLLFHSVHRQFGGRLATVVSGGAPLDPLLEMKWRALGVDLLQGYGMTETSGVVSVNTYEDHRLKSVGKALPNVQVKIDDDGQILVWGANVFGGYFKNKEKTKSVFTVDGWLKTDDLGEVDEDGFLFIRARKTYMILGAGGQNVYPEDIEYELNQLASVRASCVLGLELGGGKVEILAVLLLDSNLKSPKEQSKKAVEIVNKQLSSYQQINSWHIWDDEDFPRSLTKKIKKHQVAKIVQEQRKHKRAGSISSKKTPLMQLLIDITGSRPSQIKPNSKLVRDLHLDSLLRVELVARIEEKFGIIVDESKIDSKTRVNDLEKIIKSTKPSVKPRLSLWPTSRWASWLRIIGRNLFIFPFLRLWVRLEVEGLENLKGLPTPVIFMPNHLSSIDPGFVTMAIPYRIRKNLSMAAAQDVLYQYHPLKVKLVELFFVTFPFPRQEGQNIGFGLENMGKMLDRDRSVVVYPEGKISKNGQLLDLKRGAGFIAVGMNEAIVPVKITDPDKILPYHPGLPRRGKIKIKFGKALRFSRQDSYIEATQKIQKALESL